MKKHQFYLLLTLPLFYLGCTETPSNNFENIPYRYEYESVENDPMGALIYTLDNGLKIYMSVNHDEPRITTNIAVRSGSKQDPHDATGLAHYLEHMMFKGTSKIASLDWEKEKVVLQQISDLYETHRNTTNESEREIIYHQIDSLSGVAAQYAVPNEYDKMCSSLGSQGTNAYTWVEQTVYVNEIPSNELEKWLTMESERFHEVVLRLFHTELEAVYEEFNIGQDDDYGTVNDSMMAVLFRKHNYGLQSTIGLGEHLKNPSMEKIHEYFDKYYVPNNMAIVLSGDIDPDATVDLIIKYFGSYKNKEVADYTFEPEDKITEPIIKDVYGVDPEFVEIGFRLPSVLQNDMNCATILGKLLNNGQAGLIDLDLLEQQKVLDAYSGLQQMEDYGVFFFDGYPREGQSLEEVKTLLLSELDSIKSGNFDDWMLPAIVNNLRSSKYQELENNWRRTGEMTNAFILGLPWEEKALELDNMTKITKHDVVDYANKYFNDNYVVVNKHFGNREPFKVDKPAITKVEVNRDVSSKFHQMWDSIQTPEVQPVFVDFKKEIQNSKLDNGIDLEYIHNEINPLFSIDYILDMGTRNDRVMALAVQYLDYLGTDKYSSSELKQEMFKLGADYSVYVADNRIYVSLNGLSGTSEEAIALFENILANVVPDSEAYQNMVDGILKSRDDNKLDKRTILYSALSNYAKYGPQNPYNDVLSEKMLRSMSIDSLVNKIHQLTSYKHHIYYYGQDDMAKVKTWLDKHHKVPEKLKDYPPEKVYQELDNSENHIYYVDYDMVQTEILMMSKTGAYDESSLAVSNIFNEYFGSGLSSIVFQEIRESRALAYSAYARYSQPDKPDKVTYIRAFVGTQFNKMDDALSAMNELLNNMPMVSDQFTSAIAGAKKNIATNRTKRSSIYWNYLRAKDFNRDYDINKKIYDEIPTITLDKLQAFFNNNIKGKKYSYCVIGKKKDLDMNVLDKYGTVEELSLKQIFGY